MNSINGRKTAGLDGISGNPLKATKETISNKLTNIMNDSIPTDIF